MFLGRKVRSINKLINQRISNFSQSAFIRRSDKYSAISNHDLEFFINTLGRENVLEDKADLLSYNQETQGRHTGLSHCALLPTDLYELRNLLIYCNERRLAVVPQGARMSVLGSSLSIFDEIVINLENINKILDFDEQTGIIHAQAGCTLGEIQKACNAKGYHLPLRLGENGNRSQLGGNVAINTHCGQGDCSIRELTLGLNAMLPTGDLIEDLSKMHINNTAYDLKQLFIGSEGTLGVITECILKCPIRPKTTITVMIAVNSFQELRNIMSKSRQSLGSKLKDFIYMDETCIDMYLLHHTASNNYPFESRKYPFYGIMEVMSDEPKEYELNNIDLLINSISGHIEEFVLCKTDEEISSIWSIHDNIDSSFSQRGQTFKYEVTLDYFQQSHIKESIRSQILGSLTKEETENLIIGGFGNMGRTANINIGILGDVDIDLQGNLYKLLEPFVYIQALQVGGGITGGQAIGFDKAPYILYAKNDFMVDNMILIKNMFDPNGILNPYKVFPHGRTMIFKNIQNQLPNFSYQ